MIRVIIQTAIALVAVMLAASIAAGGSFVLTRSADGVSWLASHSVLVSTSSGNDLHLISYNENENKRNLPLVSVLLRKHEVFASNGEGIFRASLSEKKWEQVTIPAGMPRGGKFADQPEDAKVILYYASKLPSPTRCENGAACLYGLYVSEDDGRRWRLVSQKDDYGPVFLHTNGTLYAVTNAATFMR